jgi:hypothetical protein
MVVKKALLHHEPIAYHHLHPLPPQLKRITAKGAVASAFSTSGNGRLLPESR